MPRIDSQTQRCGNICSLFQTVQFTRRRSRVIIGSAIGASIELHPIRPDSLCAFIPQRIRIGEQRHPHSTCFQAGYYRRQEIRLGHEIPSVIRRRLCRIIRHECHLFRLMLFNEIEKCLAWKAFDVELSLRKLVIDQSAYFTQIGKPDVTLVWTRMYCQTGSPCSERGTAQTRNAWPWQIAPVSQHRNSVEIDR